MVKFISSSFSSVIATLQACTKTGGDKPVCEEPNTLFPYVECGWDYIDDTSGKLLNNTLVEKARVEDISAIRELGVWEVVDIPPRRGRVWHALG